MGKNQKRFVQRNELKMNEVSRSKEAEWLELKEKVMVFKRKEQK